MTKALTAAEQALLDFATATKTSAAPLLQAVEAERTGDRLESMKGIHDDAADVFNALIDDLGVDQAHTDGGQKTGDGDPPQAS